jgi:methionine biosynthesis protein MetW
VSDLRSLRAFAYESPRPEVAALVPVDARRILDIGCASGVLGAALRERGEAVEVVGIEGDPDYAADARARLDQVVEADLDTFSGWESLGGFDCVIAADVLEHLRDPWGVLRAAAGLLEPGGTAVVSLPNVRYWETFWTLAVRNTWPTRTQGIFDRTHLRWFTLRDAWGLLDQAGLSVERVERVYRLRPVGSRLDRRLRVLDRLPGRSFFVFQHLLVGRRRG